MNNSPQFKGGSTGIFNRQVSLNELREVDPKSLIRLSFSKALLFLGIVMVVLNNLNVIAPGSYFGAISWVTFIVFAIGLCINFICIPFLYFSSLNNFKMESDFWDKETFWIMPLFFFGTFFIYGAEFSVASVMLVISVVVVSLVHLGFMLEAKKATINNSERTYAGHDQYLVTLKYLTAYYVLLMVLLFVYNPLQHTFFWIRMHV